MKKIIFCFFTLLVTGSFAQAQSRYYIGAYRSFPLGEFGSTDISEGGFAEGGWGFLLENKFKFSSWPEGLHVGLHFTYQENKFDEQSLGRAFSEALGEQYEVRVFAGSFRPMVVTLGPFYEWTLNEKVSIDFKSGAGIMVTGIDPVSLNVYDDQDELLLKEGVEFQSSPNFTFMLGASVGYQLSAYWGLHLFADYAYARESIASSLVSGSSTSSHQRISFLNAGLSLSLKIH